MPRFQHPLLSAAYANIPKEQREELACCCLNGCTGLLEGRWLGDAWKKVEEQAAEGSSSSSSSGSSRYTAGKYDLGTDPLFPTFTEQASRKHGLWPQFRVWAAILAHTLPLHEIIYGSFQQHQGFVMHWAGRQLREVLSFVDGFAQNSLTIFAPEFQLAQVLCADPNLQALQRMAEHKYLRSLQPASQAQAPAAQPASQAQAPAAQPASQAQAPAAQPPSQPAPAAQPPIAQAPALPIASSSAPPQVSEAASAPSGRGRSGRRGRSRGTRGRGGGRIVSEPTPPATTSTTAAAAAAAPPSSSSAAQQLGEAGVSSSRANSSPPPSTLHRACFLTPQARQALPPAASTKVTASDLPNAMDEEEGLGADFVLHTDGQGEGVLELQQVEDDELGEEGMVRKRRKLDRPLSFARAVMQQMEAVRARGAAEIDPQVEHEPAAATFTATQEQIEQTVEGEMTGEQWAKEIQLRTSIYFQHLAGYLRSQGSSMLSTLPNQYRIASYWDAEAKGEEGGFGAFQLDSHLCSEATGRACPPSCPHCSKQPPTPKWTRAQHLENTAHSMGFFDRQDHKPAIHSALQQGQLEPVTCAEQHSIGGYSLHSTLDLWHLQYLFGTTHSMETERTINKVRMSRGIHTSNMTQQRQFLAVSGTKDQLQVTGSTWRQWCKEANEQAAARKVGMMGSGFASVLQAALSKVQASSGRGRRKWAEPGAAEQAKQAAQRREQDPAAKRMRLVQNMRYLSLKRAALLGFMQEEPASSMSAEQQRQEMDAVPKLNLAEVTAQLLDTRWSTKQLETAAAAAQAAAKEISNEKRQARAEKQGAQQQQQQQQDQVEEQEQEQQQQQQQQSEMQPAGQLCLPRSCNLAKTTSIYMESSSSESSSCSSESAEDASSSDSDWL